MPRGLVLLTALAAASLQAGIFPEQWWEYKRTSLTPVTPDDPMVWSEYGLQEAERATYDDGKVKFTATGWRLKDSTAALAVAVAANPAGRHRVHNGEVADRDRAAHPEEGAALVVGVEVETVAVEGNARRDHR